MSFGPNAPAPPPGSPPPTVSQDQISQEDRILAAVSYVGYFTGLWLVAPIVIYVVKREKSRFVAHHALRAALLHMLAIPVFFASWILALVLAFTVAVLVDNGHHGRGDQIMGGFVLVLYVLGWALPWFVYLLVCGLAAIRAFQGRLRTTTLLGRLVERMLGSDKTVAPPDARPPGGFQP
ncbi:MAG: DUF4870 domain-containing protein [Polyangiaceae bacterium]